MATTDTTAQFKRNAEEWDAAWAERDFDRVLSIYVDDVQWEDSQIPRPLRGKAELRAYFDAMLRAFPDIQIEQEQLFSPLGGDANVFASRWRIRGTFRGAFELPGIATARISPTGDRVDFTGLAIVTVDDEGRATHVRQYGDESGFQRQIGMLPPEGSFGERVMMRRRMKRNR